LLVNHVHSDSRADLSTAIAIVNIKDAISSVDHEILLATLEHYGVQGRILGWLRNFLAGRRMHVRTNGANSVPVLITRGVLSILFATRSILFAYDTALVASGADVDEAARNLTSALAELNLYFTVNKLTVSVKKTECLFPYMASTSNAPAVYHGATQVSSVHSYKILALLLTKCFPGGLVLSTLLRRSDGAFTSSTAPDTMLVYMLGNYYLWF
jgi:hypothetical protein